MASSGRAVNRLFVGNLPWTIGHRELRDYFSSFGKVIQANVVFDKRTGCSKGYGFVTLANKGKTETLANIENKNKHTLDGQMLNIHTSEN